jgi:hypothetical protein
MHKTGFKAKCFYHGLADTKYGLIAEQSQSVRPPKGAKGDLTLSDPALNE